MRRLVVALIAVLAMSGIALPQSLQNPGSKIRIMKCLPHVHEVGQSHPWIDPYGGWHYTASHFPYWDAFLEIVYQNESDTTATEIDFGLIAGGSLIAVTKDSGKFSTGVPIDHEFVVSREIFPLRPSPYCAALRVKYADGSVWQNPVLPEPQ